MKIGFKNIEIEKVDEKYEIINDDKKWLMSSFEPMIITKDNEKLYFKDAFIKEERFDKRTSDGILATYSFLNDEVVIETLVWLDRVDLNIYFELNTIIDNGNIKEIMWPGHFISKDEGYTTLPYMQGVLIRNDSDNEDIKLDFDGFFMSHDAYMSFLHQKEADYGYIMINMTPFDSKYLVDHSVSDKSTSIGIRWLTSLGNMAYKRVLRFSFKKNLDYNKAAKIYREYVKEIGLFKSLKEKEISLPNIKKLIGASVVHFGIKSHIDKNSSFYKGEDDVIVSFKERQEEIRRLRQSYKGKLYLHLDGWGEHGYDNNHPDYLPVCKGAGGYEGLKELADYMNRHGDLFGLHDQYRDYYLKAKSYDEDNAVKSEDGSIFEHSRWAGGRQNYLCASLALDYVKRNFNDLFNHDIKPTASYLDVFTCNEMDECFNVRHMMTRKECAEYREACFRYLVAKGIIPTSEECSDWAINTLVSAHYGPYEFMLKEPGSKRMGIPIPLFNLVYHDAIILPWMMEKVDEDYMLYALLNGGIPYIIREGAYPNTDGVFEDKSALNELVARCNLVTTLHKKIAYAELISHELLTSDGKVQEAIYSDGTRIFINLIDGTYEIN